MASSYNLGFSWCFCVLFSCKG